MKTLRIATIALASASITLAAPLAAQDRSQEADNTIFIQSTTEEAQYARQVARQLNRNLARYNFPLRTSEVGVVRVRFTANENGEAENMTLIGNSRSNQLDRAALWAVGRLSNIAPDYGEASGNRLIQANIVFADTALQAERMARRLAREEFARMAAARERGEPPVLALTLSPSARTR